MSADTIAAEPHLDLTESVIDAVKRVAAEEIMPRYLKVAHQRKADGSLFTEADLAAQEALTERLQAIFPGPVMGKK
jgi:myo-inositol-1(or 4)-monophosphatase